MGKLSLIVTAGFAVMLTAGSVSAHDITYDIDRHADFSRIKTFSFNREAANSGSPLVDARILKSIASSLTARGMVADDEKPDVFIVPHMEVDTRRDLTAYTYAPFGGWYYWGGGWSTTQYMVTDVQMGTLTIDMVDANTGATLWRGVSTNEVKHHHNPAHIDRDTSETVAKIMKNFPLTGRAL